MVGQDTYVAGAVAVLWPAAALPPNGTAVAVLEAAKSSTLAAWAGALRLTDGGGAVPAAALELRKGEAAGDAVRLVVAVVGCPPGYWAAAATACVACAPGSYGNRRNADGCTLCSPVRPPSRPSPHPNPPRIR
jgi:hypothetical protein